MTFFLQELAFVINQEKSVMIPKQVIEFSGMEIYLKTDYFITTREGSEYQNWDARIYISVFMFQF